ncbi:MAG: exonuclease domain-containing protein [Chitinophagaceae bacterium]
MFAIVDIETCGSKFALQHGRIIDICILVHDGISVIDKFSTLINPDCYIGSFYTKLSGITNEMVADAPRFHEIAKDILSFTEGHIFVAHNVSFDYNFIKEEFASLGYKFKSEKLCTVKLSRKLLPGKKSYSLGNLCESLGIQIENRHRAEGDAVATAKLFDILMQQKAQSRLYKSAGLDKLMTTRKDSIKKYILNKLPDTCGVYYFLNKNQEIIYIGKSVSMYSRAQSHYNSDLKKSKEMLQLTFNVDYVETGSELISLLYESEEIKKHKPFFNRARKKDTFTHGIELYMQDEIKQLRIVPYEEASFCLQVFNSYEAARECLNTWIEEHHLCLRYCGLSNTDQLGHPCFHAQIQKCFGICNQVETPTEYNERVLKIEEKLSYPHSHFLILERGRHEQEWSFVWIDNKRYKGFGYIDKEMTLYHPEDIAGYITSNEVYPDSDIIIRQYLKQHKKYIIKKLQY